jgi:hypothetical protein
MKERLVRQAQLNAAPDLDKDERQVVPPAEDDIGTSGDVLQLRQSRRKPSGIPPRDGPLAARGESHLSNADVCDDGFRDRSTV